MIWESTKILSMIDKQKWKHLGKKEKKILVAQLQIWLAIHYLIRLHLSGYSPSKQFEMLKKYYEDYPNVFNSMTLYEVMELYSRIRPIVPYLLYLNYIVLERRQKKLQCKLSQKKSRSKRKTTKSKIKLKTETKSQKQKGGFLFMLTSRGEKPIRGVDMENFLKQVDSSVHDISFLPSSGPSGGESPSHPFNGFALLYFLARNKPQEGAYYASPYINDYTNIFKGGTFKYSSLLRLWTDLQKEKNKVEKKKNMEDEYMNDYETFVKKYIGRKEYRTKKGEYQKYLNNIKEQKEKHNMEEKLYEHYNQHHPNPSEETNEKMKGYMSTLDMISMASSMLPLNWN